MTLTFHELRDFLFRRGPDGEWPRPLSRRVRRIDVTASVFEELFRAGHRSQHYEVIEGIPEDGRIVSGAYDPDWNSFAFLVESPSFPEVPDGLLVDPLQITMRQYDFPECPWDTLRRVK